MKHNDKAAHRFHFADEFARQRRHLQFRRDPPVPEREIRPQDPLRDGYPIQT